MKTVIDAEMTMYEPQSITLGADTGGDETRDYERIAAAIRYLEENHRAQPSLEDLAAHLHLSPAHLQRLFRRWAGISPKRFLQYLTVEYAKALLAGARSVLDASYGAGLSGPGRLHDLFVSVEAVTPGEFKRSGQGLRIAYGFHPSPFGECFLAVSPRGIVACAFVDGSGRRPLLDDLRTRWPAAELVDDSTATAPVLEQIFPRDPASGRRHVHLYLKGTNFQLKVWQALLQIPPGAVCSYGDVAARIDSPSASRAVGSAVGANPIAYLIPCHRVIRKDGSMHAYRWGATRKRAILGWEAAHLESGGEPSQHLVQTGG